MKKPPTFHNFILNLQRAYKLKKVSFYQDNFLGSEKFLDEMSINGFISGYKIFRNNFFQFEIFLKYDPFGNPVFFFSKTISKPGADLLIRLDKLKAFKANERFSLSIVRTANYGIILHTTAIKNKTGGQYLAKIK